MVAGNLEKVVRGLLEAPCVIPRIGVGMEYMAPSHVEIIVFSTHFGFPIFPALYSQGKPWYDFVN
jgi:hypothetical protein